MKNHKYDNTVIEVLSTEHGPEVIKWWKKQGVNTRDFRGCNTGWFYGLKAGVFSTFTSLQVCDYFLKVIKLPAEEPKPYPKMMLVKKNMNDKPIQAFVLCEIDHVFISLGNDTHKELLHEFESGLTVDKERLIRLWEYATDIEEPQ